MLLIQVNNIITHRVIILRRCHLFADNDYAYITYECTHNIINDDEIFTEINVQRKNIIIVIQQVISTHSTITAFYKHYQVKSQSRLL